jgi:pimeloyl-ACP methyl ester carboxylesterase
MGADARVFARQLEAFPNADCPAWIAPLPQESLRDYAHRFGAQVRRQIGDQPCVLGGASFGGFVATEMAAELQPLALVLIGSARSPRELPPHVRALRPLGRLAAAVPFTLASRACGTLAAAPDSLLRPATKQFLRQAADADAEFLRWACRAVLNWRDNGVPARCPVYHIHGSADRILPPRYTRPTHLLRGAGHVLSLTHARRVNEILRDILRHHADRSAESRV